MAAKQWTPNFHACEASFGRTLVWVHFTGLNVMFYDESAIQVIAFAIGCPMKIDCTTKTIEKGRYARACVEIDLSIAITRKVWVQSQLFSMEYESLHMICGMCDRYGHFSRDCS